MAAHGKADYETEARLLKPLADQGVAKAQYTMGVSYENGMGAKKDLIQAVKYFRLAADQENAEAQTSLGFMYLTGLGAPKNYGLAVKYFRLAAAQGDAEGQAFLGLMYKEGKGVPQDYAHTQFDLVSTPTTGRDEPARIVEAYKWLSLAASQATPEASSRNPANGNVVADAANLRDTVDADMSQAQVEQAQQLASDWQPRLMVAAGS
jgi:TPR repeat protein